MRLFHLVDKNKNALQNAGRTAIAELKGSRVSAHYFNDAIGAGIIEESPDGTRHMLDASGGGIKRNRMRIAVLVSIVTLFFWAAKRVLKP